MLTIRKTSEHINEEAEFFFPFRSFLDEFYRAHQSVRASLIEESPDDIDSIYFAVPYLAAGVHKLANDFRLEPPRWIFEARCFLSDDKWYFGLKARGALRRYLLYVSPPEFKFRNLFVPKNALSRA